MVFDEEVLVSLRRQLNINSSVIFDFAFL